MSGFEVVGVVLGAIPLIISALDGYKTARQYLRLFVRKELLLNQLIWSLKEQKFFIETDIRLALKAADLPEDEIVTLASTPVECLLTDLDIVSAMREYLGDGFDLYMNALSRCQEILGSIVANIDDLASELQRINKDLATILRDREEKHRSSEFSKKVKFSFQKEEIQKQIQELNKSTKALSRVKENSIMRQSITSKSTSTAATKFERTLSKIQSYASWLYAAISSSCVTGCHPMHVAKFFLQTQAAMIGKKRPQLAKAPCPSFFISFIPHPPALGVPLGILEVKLLDDNLDNLVVRYDADDNAQKTVKINLPSPPQTPISMPREVKDLCKSLDTSYQSGASYDLYLSRCAKLCHFSSPSSSPQSSTGSVRRDSHETITLKEILKTDQRQGQASYQWSMNRRLGMALTVASSMIQLHSTEWLQPALTSSSIAFMRDAIDDTKLGSTVLQPFLTCTFPTQENQASNKCMARNSTLELGIVLLELWHAKSIEAYAAQAGLDLHHNYASRYEVARYWLDYSDDDIMLFYKDLVERSIECTFATELATPSWQDSVFRSSVCEYILKPLWENCPPKFR